MTVTYYSAKWCSPCRTFSPIMEELFSSTYKDIELIKINIDSNPEAAAHDNITSIPTIIIREQDTIIGRHTGAMPKNKAIDFLNTYLTPNA
jgi:thioredoxin 1